MKVRFSSLNFKTGQNISLNLWNRAYYVHDVVMSGFEDSFVFFIY